MLLADEYQTDAEAVRVRGASVAVAPGTSDYLIPDYPIPGGRRYVVSVHDAVSKHREPPSDTSNMSLQHGCESCHMSIECMRQGAMLPHRIVPACMCNSMSHA